MYVTLRNLNAWLLIRECADHPRRYELTHIGKEILNQELAYYATFLELAHTRRNNDSHSAQHDPNSISGLTDFANFD